MPKYMHKRLKNAFMIALLVLAINCADFNT